MDPVEISEKKETERRAKNVRFGREIELGKGKEENCKGDNGNSFLVPLTEC